MTPPRSPLVLGLNAFHADAAAALVRGGEVVAAAEEERFRREKHWAGLPRDAARWCLREAGVDLAEVDLMAVNRDPTANLGRKARHVLTERPSVGLLWDRLKNMVQVDSVSEQLASALDTSFGGRLVQVEHHRAHQASAYLVSPFEEAALLSVDGFGDFSSASWGLGRGRDLRIDGRVYFPHSLGLFYLTLTQYLGFPRYGDEYKVMGLAPYGEPRFLDEMREVVPAHPDGTFRLNLKYFRHDTEDLDYRWDGGRPTVEDHFTEELERLLGPARDPGGELTDRHRDVARSTQARFEEAVFDLLEPLHEATGERRLVLSGGAAMNSVMNGKVLARSPFEEVYVPPAPGDAGGAVGAALWASREDDAEGARPPVMATSFLGPSFPEEDARKALAAYRDALDEKEITVTRAGSEDELIESVLETILEGGVVGWFQGRMEFGPRALGNRSILCDPRREDMREIINKKVKRREAFRPFAPTVLRGEMGEWFEVDDDVPFMMKVYPIREARREEVPAVCHVNGTGRPQTVTEEQNPLYYRLIRAFFEETGVPMLLNTSFNENEPIVCRPEEAVDCFLRTDMNLLALGRLLAAKPPSEAERPTSEKGAPAADGEEPAAPERRPGRRGERR